jgi:putative transposase
MFNHYTDPFIANRFYHVYCRAVGESVLFRNDDNRRFFLDRYKEMMSLFVDTYCYALLNNHVHWLVKARSMDAIAVGLADIGEEKHKKHQKKMLDGKIGYDKGIEFQYKDYFISYAKAYNKMYNRLGALFVSPFRRILVTDDSYFERLCVYIHANPQKHKIVKRFEDYQWSSYNILTGTASTWLKREELLNWFGGREAFIASHQRQIHREDDEFEAIE